MEYINIKLHNLQIQQHDKIILFLQSKLHYLQGCNSFFTIIIINLMRSLKLFNKILQPFFFKPHLNSGALKKIVKYGTIAFGFAIMYKFQKSINSPILCIQDNNTISARRQFDSAIKEMRRAFGQMAVYPEIKIITHGNTYLIEFQVDQRKCDGIDIISSFLETFKSSSDFSITGGGSLKENDVMTFNLQFVEKDGKFKTQLKGSVTITMVKDGDRPSSRFIFQKADVLTNDDLRAIIRAYKESITPREDRRKAPRSLNTQGNSNLSTQKKKPDNQNVQKLSQLGAIVFDPSDKISNLDWEYLAGYQKQKRDIEDTVLLALTHADIYDKISQGTRMLNQPNRPKAVLFQGPPGTGKTTSAKIIAQQVNIPLVYIPLEAVMSKFYGESEKRLADLWQACTGLGRAIIFIDEIDAIAGNRSSDMHEASRRILSTLLRKIDSFQSTTDVLLICATNRKNDIDAAMLSRIDLSIKFDLPDKISRAAIFKRYAKQLSEQDRQRLSDLSEGFSGRNISDVCKNAERRWASKLIRNEVKSLLPQIEEYVQSLKRRKQNELDRLFM